MERDKDLLTYGGPEKVKLMEEQSSDQEVGGSNGKEVIANYSPSQAPSGDTPEAGQGKQRCDIWAEVDRVYPVTGRIPAQLI